MPFDPITGAAIEKGAEELQKMRWFRTMNFGQALLLLVIGLVSAASYMVYQDAMNRVIPSHLGEIQKGYERINTENVKVQSDVTAMAVDAHKTAAEKDKQHQVLIEKLVDKLDKKDEFIKDMLRESKGLPPERDKPKPSPTGL